MNNRTRQFIRKYGLGIVAFFFALLFLATVFLPASDFSPKKGIDYSATQRERGWERHPKPANIPKLSEIKAPSIDEHAAEVACQEATEEAPEKACATLPLALWVFLLASYAALVIFNLAYAFGRQRRLQWGWELLYTLLFLLGWQYWDQCAAQLWFPVIILNLGILLYFIYLYFFEKKN